MLRYIYRLVKGRLQIKTKKELTRKLTAHLDKTTAKERYTEKNIDEELKRFNLELYELSQKFQELHDLIRT